MISVVIPVYKNAATVESLHGRLVSALQGPSGLQIIFVDDACPAGSAEVLDQLSHDHAETEVLHLPTNQGQHAAALAGLASATGRWSVVMDADLQDPPEAAPALVEKGEEGYDAVFAGRQGAHQPLGRRLTSRLFKRTLALTCNVPVGAGMCVALNRTAVDRLLGMDGPAPFLPAMIGRAGLRITAIPVERAPREQGSSAYTSTRRLATALSALRWASWQRFSGRRRSL